MAIKFANVAPKEAIAYFQRKGYAIGFDWQDVAQREHARAFTVAKVTRLDILEDIRGAVDTAIQNGVTPAEFKKNLRPILQAKGWWGVKEMTDPVTGEIRRVQLGSARRLHTIFDTNVRTSYAAGHWQRIQRLKDRRPYLRYVAVIDGRTRARHRAWHGTVLPVDHVFWKTHYPPNGWRCRCTVVQLSDRELKRYGHTVSPDPAVQTRPWRNPRTGEIHDVPTGIDPGFAHNVGRSAERVPIDPAKYRLPAIGHESARLSVMQPDFERFLSGKIKGRFPVGYIEEGLAKAIGADVRRVDLSDETLAKQIANHPDLTVNDYRLIPEIFAHGRVVQDGALTLGIHHVGDRIYYAAVKATGSGKALFLQSFRLSDTADIKRVMRRSKLIRDWVKN